MTDHTAGPNILPLMIAIAVGVLALLAFTFVAMWATSHGGSDVTGWPLWQGFSRRPL